MPKPIASLIFSIFFAFALLLNLPDEAFSQRSFGIEYKVPGDETRFKQDLHYLRQTGINSLLLSDITSSRHMNIIEDAGFDVYVSVPVSYPTIWSLQAHNDELVGQWVQYIDHYKAFSNVKGIGLFSFGQTHSDRFRRFFERLNDDFRQLTNLPFYYVSTEPAVNEFSALFDYRLFQVADTSVVSSIPDFSHFGGIIYSPDHTDFDIRAFQSLLNVTDETDLTIFLKWDWFIANLGGDNLMEEVIYAYAHDADALFANPRIEAGSASSNWLILILLMIWCSFMAHYSFIPTYRKSLIRFFDTHRFFIKDVVERHIRVSQSNFIILIQQGLMGGLFLLTMTTYLLTATGYEALVYHLSFSYPYLPGNAVIFLAGFTFVVLINLICFGWLYLLNSGLRQPGQAAIFQLWPQHVNLIIITLLITLVLAGWNIILINIVAVLFLLVFFGSFIFAVIDAGNHTQTRFFYYPLTVLIYGIILFGFLIWVYVDTGFIEAWDLAVTL